MFATHLKEILADTVVILPENGRIVLREKNVMEVELTDVPPNITALNIRRIGILAGVRDGNWKQICDYLLVYECDGKDVGIFVELKKTLNQQNKGKEQLRRSLPLLKYLHSMCQVHYGVKNQKPRLVTRYFLIGSQLNHRLDKQPVRPGQPLSSENYKNITVNKFVGRSFRFGRLRDE